MITSEQLINKLGKRGFNEFAKKNMSKGETQADIERRAGRGTNIKYRRCEHGVWTIDNYVKKPCEKCNNSRRTKNREFTPYFNVVTGAFYEAQQEVERDYKARGFRFIGDSRSK